MQCSMLAATRKEARTACSGCHAALAVDAVYCRAQERCGIQGPCGQSGMGIVARLRLLPPLGRGFCAPTDSEEAGGDGGVEGAGFGEGLAAGAEFSNLVLRFGGGKAG